MVRALVANRLSSFDISRIEWSPITQSARGLSHAEVTRACDDAAKEAVLSDGKFITTSALEKALQLRRKMHPQLRSNRTRAR